MYARVITPPKPAVTLERAKAHLVVEHDDDDGLIEAYVAAATGTLDGPDGWLGRALGVQTLEARFDAFPCEDLMRLPYAPIVAIEAIKYDDADGVEQTLVDPTHYGLWDDGALLAWSASWPTARSRRGAVRIRYTAGYAALPAPIEAAILLMTGDLYANRETVKVGQIGKVPMSMTVENLLSTYRRWSF